MSELSNKALKTCNAESVSKIKFGMGFVERQLHVKALRGSGRLRRNTRQARHYNRASPSPLPCRLSYINTALSGPLFGRGFIFLDTAEKQPQGKKQFALLLILSMNLNLSPPKLSSLCSKKFPPRATQAPSLINLFSGTQSISTKNHSLYYHTT